MVVEEIVPSKKTKYFCFNTFRKELKTTEALKSLKRFISFAQNNSESDVVVEYLENGGSLMEILAVTDTTAKADLTTALPVFEATQLILLRFQSPNSEYYQHCVEGAKKILHYHIDTIQLMLSMNMSKHKKVALKLLTAIVTLQFSFASEVLNLFSPSPKMIEDLLSLSSEKDSVRKYFIFFILSFLIEGSQTVLKTLIDSKGFLSAIIPGLKYDEVETVTMTLSLMEDKILKNMKISKTLKLKIFNTQVIKSLFDLYNWKGPQSLKQNVPGAKKKHKFVEVKESDKTVVVDFVHSFLLVLCTSKKYGISFTDKSFGMSDTTNNQLLLTVFEGLPDPLSNVKVTEILLKTLICCPDLIKPILNKLEPFFQPRDSDNWFAAIKFGECLIKEINVVDMLRRMNESSSESQALKVIKAFCVPISLLRTAKSGFQNSHTLDVRIHSIKLFSVMWDATQHTIRGYQKDEQGLNTSFADYFSKHVPDLQQVVELWLDICKKDFGTMISTEVRASYLVTVLKAIKIIVKCQIDVAESLLPLATTLLNCLDDIRETIKEEDLVSLQSEIVQFVEIDFHSLTPNTPLFKTALLISLQTSLACASKILSNLDIFDRRKPEVDVWLLSFASLSNDHTTLVAECLLESVNVCYHSDKKEITYNFEDEQHPAPLIFYCLEMLKSYASDGSEKELPFRQYLWDVIIHLQHFYPDRKIFKYFKRMKKVLCNSLLEYLKHWSSNYLSSSNLEAIPCPIERELTSWLLQDQDIRDLKEILKNDLDHLKLYRLLKMTLGHLVVKIANDDFDRKHGSKYLKVLSQLASQFDGVFEVDDDKEILISYDSNNSSVFLSKFTEFVFLSDTLWRSFDVFADKNSSSFYWTRIVAKILMQNEHVRKATSNKRMVQRWKSSFLESLKVKFENGESIEAVDHVESVLNFFEYKNCEILELLNILSRTSNFNMFVDHNKQPTKWALILTKFVVIQCREELLNEKILETLCDLMKYLNTVGCCSFEIFDECFVSLLRGNSKHLLSIKNELIEVILKRSSVTAVTVVLSKLLLNDPSKVTQFLLIASEYLESDLIFPMLSALFMEIDPFFDVIRSEEASATFKNCETSEQKTPELFTLMENVYNKYENHILSALRGDEENVISENLIVAQVLISLFMDKKILKLLKKDVKRGKFNPELVLEAVKKFKSEMLVEAYLKGLIVLFCKVIRDPNCIKEDVWAKYSIIVREVLRLNSGMKWLTIVDSTEWKDFFKLALGACFKTSMSPHLLMILRTLIGAFYETKDSNKTTCLFFQMLISHSQFLNSMLTNSPLKDDLVKLFLCLVERSTSEMTSKHIPILLASYSASLSSSDRVILNILRLYEANGYKFGDYEPLVWGETAVSHYSLGNTTALSLWQRISMPNVLDLLDGQKIEFSLKEFPIHRNLSSCETESSTIGDENVYDPVFLLPLFVNLLSPGAVVFPLPFVYKGALAYTIRALSSECKNIRTIASLVLARFYNHIQLSQNLKQKLVWMHFINCLRFGTENLAAQPVPNIVTLFFARMSLELTLQPAEMHVPLQKFLLAKSYFAFNVVPEFLPLFQSSHVYFKKHREWLLNILKDGTKTDEDVRIIFYTMAFKVIFCFFSSGLCDNMETRKLIIQVLERVMNVKMSKLLISEYGLLTWINTIDETFYPAILHDLIQLLSRCSELIIKDVKSGSDLFNVVRLLNILFKILPAVKLVKSIDAFHDYLNVLYRCLVLLVGKNKSEWFEIIKHKIHDLIDAGVHITGVDTTKITSLPFYFRQHEEKKPSEVTCTLEKTVFLFHMLVSRK